MKKRCGVLAATLLLACSLVAAAWPQNPASGRGKYSVAGLDDDREVEQFFLALQEAIGKGDKERVASMVSYPIKVRFSPSSRRWVTIRNRAQFVRRYDSIFDKAFRQLILQTRAEDLWAKSSGVAMPRGEIWINGVVKDEARPDEYQIKVTAINGKLPGT